MQIKEILTIDLSEDIKNVIDLEDLSEREIQSEIENYIVTDGLAKEYDDFVTVFTSTILETGVWISGFYGSGKSYFGKLLGYLLSNKIISGTPARERILQRFSGITDEALIKNSISKLNAFNCRVVFLDVAKQDTSKGLAYTLFKNFLKSLNLPQNEYGYFLFQMMIEEQSSDIGDFIFQKLGKNWIELKKSPIQYAGAAKEIFLASGKTESDYDNILKTLRNGIDQFDASSLKNEIDRYLEIVSGERVIFLFDEASEAVNQGKINLLELEGLSESLSSLGGKVWTIAIAQEKLNDVINNSNVSVAQLTKVTDRFKTKIHLEATEVDTIIRSRLLKKTASAMEKLREYFQSNSGAIADHSTLTGGVNKTEDADSYVTYYPFYKNQFEQLQNFLFGTKGYASTKVAARGMIFTAYEILKKELQNQEIFTVATGWQIARTALSQPSVRLVNRLDNAEKRLKEHGLRISGRRLLETVNFLNESEIAQTSISNIVKSFIGKPQDFYHVQPEIEKALELLVEAKILLFSNGTYRISSDIEQRLLDEMEQFAVQTFMKKTLITTNIKASSTVKTLARLNDNNLQYDFYLTTDGDDELTNPNRKELKFKIKSLYNISEDRTADIDTLKTQHQNDKDIIWLIPDNSAFKEIDKLIDEIKRIEFIEQKYQSGRSEEAPIVQSFLTAKAEKENHLKNLIDRTLQNGTAVYLYNTSQLDKDNWQTTLQSQQRQVVNNLYFKRLDSQLSDDIAAKIIKEGNAQKLKTYFAGADFRFFDAEGNFVGEKLKPAEEILYRIRNNFVDGLALQNELEKPPTGYSFGTVISTLAALMRGGKIIAKYDGDNKFSWREDKVGTIFSNATQFRKASFKAVSKSLSSQQKNEIVTTLQNLDYETHTGSKVDWNTNDFDLGNAVRELAKRFADKVDDMRTQHREFDTLFAGLDAKKNVLNNFTGVVSENNYIDKANEFTTNKESYTEAVIAIEKAEKFVGKNLPKLREWKRFADGVTEELSKSARTNAEIAKHYSDFQMQYGAEIVKNFAAIQQTVQKIKDEYYSLMKTAAEDMAGKYGQLKNDAEKLIAEINLLPAGLNAQAANKANTVAQFAEQRTKSNVALDWDVKDKETKFTYSEMLSFIDLYNSKKTEIDILKSSLIREVPQIQTVLNTETTPQIKVIQTKMPERKLKIGEYRIWLQSELQRIANSNEADEIEIND